MFRPTGLSHDEICSLFDYDPETGEIKRKFKVRGSRSDGKTGGRGGHKYIRIGFRGFRIYAHRLAWFIYHGHLDRDIEIDHLNGNGYDNRICNLRLATSQQNSFNIKKHADNQSGYKWVYFDKRRQKFSSRVSVNGRSMFLGYYINPEDAHMAALKVAMSVHKEFFRSK